LSSFAENLKNAGVDTVHVDWKPPLQIIAENSKLLEAKKRFDQRS